MRQGTVRAIWLLAATLLLSRALPAQTTGNLEGSVTDPSGAALPGVTVELSSPNLQGTRAATTGPDGMFHFPALPPGGYAVRASLQEFRTVEAKATVALDATIRVALQLPLATT